MKWSYYGGNDVISDANRAVIWLFPTVTLQEDKLRVYSRLMPAR